ncbi:MAG: AmmeMemoRadiSam system protein B [Patescibacteria group bacterium]
MLVFAAFVPHPPLILPNIGRDAALQFPKTKAAFDHLETELYAAKPDTVVIISPHGTVLFDAFLINLADQYVTDFSEFGDVSTALTWRPNVRFVEDFRSSAGINTPVTVTSERELDHGAAVPLTLLLNHLPNVSIVPISYSLLDLPAHVTFGAALKEYLARTNQRVAVIASGDLSHRVGPDSPAGFSELGVKFDVQIQELVRTKNLNQLLKLDPKMVEEARECGLRSLVTLFGIMQEYNYQTNILAYESPFGVGHLTAQFVLR